MTTKCIWLTFRKLTTKDKTLEGKKISITLKTQSQTLKLKSSRPIKNGIANFYGESFSLPLRTNQFLILVNLSLTPKIQKTFCQFVLGKEKIRQFTHRKNIFISDSAQIKVTWQAQILDEQIEENEPSQQSENDFFQLEQPFEYEKEKNQRNVFSPVTRQPKPKRKSFRLRNQQTASQPPSDSPHKFTLNTNDTNRKTLQKRNTLEPLNKIRQVSIDPSSSQQQLVHPIFKSKSKQKISSKIRFHHVPLTPQNRPRLQNNRVNILNRINFKSMVCTSVLGIISGLTAAQI